MIILSFHNQIGELTIWADIDGHFESDFHTDCNEKFILPFNSLKKLYIHADIIGYDNLDPMLTKVEDLSLVGEGFESFMKHVKDDSCLNKTKKLSLISDLDEYPPEERPKNWGVKHLSRFKNLKRIFLGDFIENWSETFKQLASLKLLKVIEIKFLCMRKWRIFPWLACRE